MRGLSGCATNGRANTGGTDVTRSMDEYCELLELGQLPIKVKVEQ